MHIGIASPVSTKNIEHIFNLGKGTLPECISGTNVAVIISNLIKAGHKISIYSLSKFVGCRTTCKFGDCSMHIGYYRPNHRAWNLFKNEINEVKDMICNDPPEIVHANWSYEFAMGSLDTRIPVMVTLRDWASVIFRIMPDHYRFARLILNNQVLKKAKSISANSPYIQKMAEKKLNRPVPLIPNPIDNSSFLYGTRTYNNKSRFRIISVNNGFTKRKNVSVLMKAFPIVCKNFPKAELLLVGEDYEENGKAQSWAVQQKIDVGRIKFLGSVYSTKLVELYDRSDLLVHPSIEESFGNTLVEAMARKVPVIAGKESGAVPWVLDYGKAGILSDINIPGTLAQDIITLLSNRNLWMHYSQAGFENAFTRFRASVIIDLYIKEYVTTINKFTPDRPT